MPTRFLDAVSVPGRFIREHQPAKAPGRQHLRRLPDFRRGAWARSQRVASGVARLTSPSPAGDWF
ncbi:MAG: hypothetical protein DME17_18605 [Candidatus Rokuibacteriota bacterium]|nr:MAG: hypothetical protein DME17_18605 [Candidatus Rokubacteria bacterium]PYN12829.1 MAG: hypothetical protein DME06_08350 [Candidatus Rokubacteria bacterium]